MTAARNGNGPRFKGIRGETEVAAIFRAAGFDCDRTPNSGGLRVRGDLTGSVPSHLEVKRQEVLRLPTWLRQAESEAPAGVTPVVAFRQNNGAWYAALPLEHLAALMALADSLTAEVDRMMAAERPVTL